ncbi:Polar organelle development protein [Piscirickettsia salmonis]|uniref:Sel1 repeat family protein n=2 Tax=Piscirickettsia salmonis TaxID=1238 RepID=A0A1L6TBT1_PISSA|nr:tetratricopeptide repeat protein [Piscirickettsia salmonis]AKP73934.1 hypothetical protein PSLF89_2183 [Piscirickettsia salmonis LF-89 = ATCC VR-1361]ALB22753.1 sel1 repeat family protein [Piscirickettsia salmonis]ALY02750.1 hypothetical protein AWE47_07690 [Piscirickettsia salmonis]AMA42296.1 hypothetical protein AWJ11_07875 [Piscirickettsia salmonis]AOS34771.1 hypothetical protein AVM72_05035 [Piscirickettsia salmonis]
MSQICHLEQQAKHGDANAQYMLALKYIEQEQLDKAFEVALAAAKYGHREARFYIGNSLFYGRGIEIDQERSIFWYLKAAQQGHLAAMMRVAQIFDYGCGQKEDKEEAAHWYSIAAKRGYVAAQSRLGDLYVSGQGVRQDEVQAFHWYLRAARSEGDGFINAMKVALCYEVGIGIRQNIEMAVRWYRIAAEKGHTDAAFYLDKLKRAIKRYYLATEKAHQGNPAAQYQLGKMFEAGILVNKNKNIALAWYQRAAKQGYEEAQFAIHMIDELKTDNPFHVLSTQLEPSYVKLRKKILNNPRSITHKT